MDCCTFLLDKSAHNSRFIIGVQQKFRAKNWQPLLDNDGTPSDFHRLNENYKVSKNYRG